MKSLTLFKINSKVVFEKNLHTILFIQDSVVVLREPKGCETQIRLKNKKT